MLKNMRFVMLTGAVMAVYLAPVFIEAADDAPVKEEVKEVKDEPKPAKKGCGCGKK